MKLLVDLFACQTGSRYRGIGRYTKSLIREMIRLKAQREVIAIGNSLYPDTFEDLRQEYIRLLPIGSFLPYCHQPVGTGGEEDSLYGVAASLVKHAYQVIDPDVVLYPSIFEGWMESGVVSLPELGLPSSFNVAIIYDFIPYIFADKFLDPNPPYKEFYLIRLAGIKNFDLLLAISESTRQDAIKILQIEPEKVVNISAAADRMFKKIDDSSIKSENLFLEKGIIKPYIFYKGNIEHHKNHEMALRAFSRLPHEIRTGHQFVLTHSGGDETLKKKAIAMGIKDDELVIADHISDEELILLYNRCKLFIFPSLLEGFGFPILEAMACGAPVIASNASSNPEVIGRSDVLFDASSEEAITAALQRALADDNFREDLSAYGLERVKEFSWEKSASRAWKAIEDSEHKNQQSYREIKSISTTKSTTKIRVAYVSPLPPERSGIANYSAELLPYLSDYVHIDLFVSPGLEVSDSYIRKNYKLYPWTELLDRADQYDMVLYQMGNSHFHTHMLNLLKEFPGVVVLHDFYLNNLANAMEELNVQKGAFVRLLDHSHGLRGKIDYVRYGGDYSRKKWPMNWEIIRNAQKIIVHSSHQKYLYDHFYKGGWKPKFTHIKQLRKIAQETSLLEKNLIHNELGLDKGGLVLCSFGFIAQTKLNLQVVQAFAESKVSQKSKSILVLVGELEGSEYGKNLLRTIEYLGIKNQVRITGYVDIETYQKYLQITDIAIQLRTDTRGETSRAVLDCMSHGLPVIINSHGSLNEYEPDDVVILPDPPNIKNITEALNRLSGSELLRLELGQRARRVIAEQHNPEKVAKEYARVIYQAYQSSDRKLFAPLINLLAQNDGNSNLLQTTAKCAAKNRRLRFQHRTLIDVSNTAGTDWRGGIQREVKNIISELFSSDDISENYELIRIIDGKLYRAFRFAEKLFNLPEGSLGEEEPLTIRIGDNLFMLDTSWNQYNEYIPHFQKVRQQGGKITTIVFDMIPEKFPETCQKDVLEYNMWLDSAIMQSDELIGISQAVANDIAQYVDKRKINPPHRLALTYYELWQH